MPSNKIIIASAGSGKTTSIVDSILSNNGEKSLITTYTINNTNEIKKKFFEKVGVIPHGVAIIPWFSFLLKNFIRPYQSYIYDKSRISNVMMVRGRSGKFTSKGSINHYINKNGDIYSDKLAEFGCESNSRSCGAVINRLSHIYKNIYIDEIQDMAGYDLNLIEIMLNSKLNVMLVGDPRQSTFKTNNAAKNSRYAGSGIVEKFYEWEKKKLCSIEEFNDCYRCNAEICKFADSFYPTFPNSNSCNFDIVEHSGIFAVKTSLLDTYFSKFKPKVLRYDRNTCCGQYSEHAFNFGESKGLTFDHVLIFPNGKLKTLLETGKFVDISKSPEKYYVGITRARHSVAFVYDGKCGLDYVKEWCE